MACQEVTRIRLPLSLIPMYPRDRVHVNQLLRLLWAAMVEAVALRQWVVELGQLLAGPSQETAFYPHNSLSSSI